LRFPWGSLFGLRCGDRRFSAPPRWTMRRGAVARPRHRRFRLGVPALRSRPFARPGGRGIDRAIRTASFGRTCSGAPLSDAFSAPRMRTTLGPSRSSCCLHRIASTSDVLVVTLRHARAGLLPSDALPVRDPCESPLRLTWEPKGPRFALPVKATRATTRGRLPSSPERASRNPLAGPMRQRLNESACPAHRFAFSRPVPRVRRCFELPSG